MQEWDLLLTGGNVATMAEDGVPYGAIENGAIAIASGAIAWVGSADALPVGKARQTRSLAGRWITPALVDCHTHLAFAGNRAQEFAMRLDGATYEEIARAGGGIMSTVNSTRTASNSALRDQSANRLMTLRAEGCGTVEIKSGYGLDAENEMRQLETARRIGEAAGITVRTTFLGAHACPPDYRDNKDEFVKLVCEEMLPAVAEAGLADAVDAYCESIAFSTDQVARVFESARQYELPVKLHADQLSDCGGAELAAEFDALSADHLEYTSHAGVAAMAESGTVAVMLPGAFLTLGETQRPPISALREAGVPIAVATDCNPGTSPICSIRTAMTLATDLFRMTPEECLTGVTRNAAKALGLDDRGVLKAGMRADVAVWNVGHPQELSYWIGTNELEDLYIGGDKLPL
jgi:imidazolonepropionase